MQKVPTIVEERYSEIIDIVEGFCKKELNDKYLLLAVEICKEISAMESSAITKGKASSWACGIVHALGMRNGLFNGKKNPSIKAGELYKAFGVSSSTGLSKSKDIRSLINLDDEKWDIEREVEDESFSEISSSVIKEDILGEVALTNLENNLEKDNLEEMVKKAITEVKEAIKELEEEELILTIADEKILKANKIVDEAWNQKNYNKKVKLAYQALEISEDCSEAYIILSYNESITGEEQKKLVLKAVDSSKKIIGEENIEKYIGKFLDAEIAKPYFSANYRLGALLWSLGEKEEAIDVYSELLRLSPEDNLMIRGILLSWLILENKVDDIEKILNKYNNDYLTSVKFSKALYYFKLGKYNEAERLLKIATVGNKFVLPYIIKQKKLPKSAPLLKELGGEAEAINYMKFGEAAWNSIDGAIQWVKDFKNKQPF